MSAPRLIKVRRDQLEPHPDLANHPTATRCLEILKESAAEKADQVVEATRLVALFTYSTSTAGILDPLHICPRSDRPGHYWILDGRHRMEGSTATEFEAWLHQEAEAESIILSAFFDRRNFTQDQLAWFLINKWPDLADTESRKGGRPKNCSILERFSLRGVSERYGVRQADLIQAAKLYREAKKKKRLLQTSASVACGCGLGALIRGLGYVDPEGNNPPRPPFSAVQTDKKFRSFYRGFRDILIAGGVEAEAALEEVKGNLVLVCRDGNNDRGCAVKLRSMLKDVIKLAEKAGQRSGEELDPELGDE